MLPDLAKWMQSTPLSSALAASTWAYPVIGALHVLGLAWFGGAALLAAMRQRPRAAMLWAGAGVMVVTGVLLVLIEPLRCAASKSFGIKLVALAAAAIFQKRGGILLNLLVWAVVIFASRGIAFF